MSIEIPTRKAGTTARPNVHFFHADSCYRQIALTISFFFFFFIRYLNLIHRIKPLASAMLKEQSGLSAMQTVFSMVSMLQWAGKEVAATPLFPITSGILLLTCIPFPHVALQGDQSLQGLTRQSGSSDSSKPESSHSNFIPIHISCSEVSKWHFLRPIRS